VVEIPTKLVVDDVECKWIDGRVDEHKTECYCFEHVKENVEGGPGEMPVE